jgi:predicted nucleic acid-binding protein
MDLVVDTNVLISALMADPTVRAVITMTEDDLHTPEYAYREIE